MPGLHAAAEHVSAFLAGPGVEKITLQQACPFDGADHLAIPYDSAAIQYVRNALGAGDPSFHPICDPSVPVLGSLTFH